MTNYRIEISINKTVLKTLVFMLAIIAITACITGCAPKVREIIVTKEVIVPVKCNLKLPEKPREDSSFESHKELAIYYKKVEQIAKDCTKDDD